MKLTQEATEQGIFYSDLYISGGSRNVQKGRRIFVSEKA